MDNMKNNFLNKRRKGWTSVYNITVEKITPKNIGLSRRYKRGTGLMKHIIQWVCGFIIIFWSLSLHADSNIGFRMTPTQNAEQVFNSEFPRVSIYLPMVRVECLLNVARRPLLTGRRTDGSKRRRFVACAWQRRVSTNIYYIDHRLEREINTAL